MSKNLKTYTIRFSKAGVMQYADFRFIDGKLINPTLTVHWVKADEIPSLEGIETIDEILKILKEFSYANKAEIYLINGVPVSYFNNEKAGSSILKLESRYESFIQSEAEIFYRDNLESFILSNNWKVTDQGYICQPREGLPYGEVINQKALKEFEYLCYRFNRIFGEPIIDMKGEQERRLYQSDKLLRLIPSEYFKARGVLIE